MISYLSGFPNYLHRLSQVEIYNLQQRHRVLQHFDEDFLLVAQEILNKLQLPNPLEIISFEDCKNVYKILVEGITNL